MPGGLRGGACTRFHPNRRASIDHSPGPSIARAPAMVASRNQRDLSPGSVKIFNASTRAANVPATGVHSPAIKRIPTPRRIAEVTVVDIGGSPHNRRPARTTSTEPTTTRISSKPAPGQPPANVEYKRRTRTLSHELECQICRAIRHPKASRTRHSFEAGMQGGARRATQ